MQIHFTGSLLLLALLAPVVSAQGVRLAAAPESAARPHAEAPASYSLQESRLWVEGNSTVRRYTCEAERIDARIDPDPANRSLALGELETSVRSVRLAVPVAALACGDNTMDGHMRRALKADAHPTIEYQLTSHQVVVQGGKATVRMNGRLRIAGKTNPVTLTAEATPERSGMLRVKGSRELRMTEFGVTPPTLMMGALKVHDPVVVHFDLMLRP